MLQNFSSAAVVIGALRVTNNILRYFLLFVEENNNEDVSIRKDKT